AGRWIAFRQPVLRVVQERMGRKVDFTYQANPGEVWEEDEFWNELSWRIDPDGSLGIRKYYESPYRPGEKITIDEYYRWIFENSIPGLPEKAAAEGLSPLAYMRKYGAFEIANEILKPYEQELPEEAVAEGTVDPVTGVVYAPKPRPGGPNAVPLPAPPAGPLGVPI